MPKQESTGMLTPLSLWSFEEKYKQANPLYLTDCIYPRVAKRVKKNQKKKKRKETDTESKGAREGAVTVGWEFSAHFSMAAERSQQRPAVYISCVESLPFALKMLYWFFSSTSGSSQVSMLFAIE